MTTKNAYLIEGWDWEETNLEEEEINIVTKLKDHIVEVVDQKKCTRCGFVTCRGTQEKDCPAQRKDYNKWGWKNHFSTVCCTPNHWKSKSDKFNVIAQKVIDRDEEYNYYMYPFTFSNNHTSTIQQRMEKIRKRAKVKVNSSIFWGACTRGCGG